MPRRTAAVLLDGFEVAVLPSPLGPVCAAATPDAIIGVEIRAHPDSFIAGVARRTGRPLAEGGRASQMGRSVGGQGPDVGRASGPTGPARPARCLLDCFAEELASYVGGSGRVFSGPIAFEGLSDWDRRVLERVREIPFGETASYGEIARRVGAAGAARAAGGAVGRNPLALAVPCHRVIAGDGTLGGYGGSWPIDRDAALDLKERLLAIEGVRVGRRT